MGKGRKLFSYHVEALEFIKKELEQMPQQEADYIAAELLTAFSILNPNTDYRHILGKLLLCRMTPNSYLPGKGRPEKESQRASRPTLNDLIITPGDCNLTKPQQIKRIEYLLKEYVKRPRDLAHLAIAIEGEKWAQASALKTAFYDIAKDIIKDDRKTGKISSFKDARERAERPGTKQNENNTIKNNLDKFKALLQSKEI